MPGRGRYGEYKSPYEPAKPIPPGQWGYTVPMTPITCHAEKCPVCEGAGRERHKMERCPTCKGERYILVPNKMPKGGR